jgi:branched-chain amino acid transport system permease protein
VLDWWVALPVAGVVGLVVGFLISLPAIRLRGIYFALLTIGLVELCRAYTGQDKCNLGGAQGLYGASSFIPSDMMGSLTGYRYAYAAALLMVIVSLLIYWKVNDGRVPACGCFSFHPRCLAWQAVSTSPITSRFRQTSSVFQRCYCCLRW